MLSCVYCSVSTYRPSVPKKNIRKHFFNYTICMFAFASAIVNQYLVIPIAAACVLDKTKLKYLYFVEGLGFVLLNFNEFNLAVHFENVLPPIYIISF